MKQGKYYSIAFLILFNFATYAQEALEVKGLGTTFIVLGSIGNQLQKGKCPCSVLGGGKCSLFEFKIQRVLHFFENNAFSEEELLSVDKILIRKNVKLERGKDYVISLRPGTSKSYIQYTDTLKIDPKLEYKVMHLHGYFSDFVKCDGQMDSFRDF